MKMTTLKDIHGSNGDMTSLSTLKIVPLPELDGGPNPLREFGADTRDDALCRSSRSDRLSKRDGGPTSKAQTPSTPARHRQNKFTPTNINLKRLNRDETSYSKSKAPPSDTKRRERSASFQNPSACESRAFDYSSIGEGGLDGSLEESSEAINIPSSASAMSKLLGTTCSASTAPVKNTNSPKRLKSTSPKKMVSEEANPNAKKVSYVGTAKVYSRALIPPKLEHSSSTGLWISTINTSSNSSGDVKAFSFLTEQEARASAYANAPPIMTLNGSECMLCNNKFNLLRRRKNCRNCGICICNNFSCSTNWKAKMIPETYSRKTNSVKVCTSCDTLAKRFQHSLLEGRYETAVELYLTGNINLRVPFAFKGEKEDMLPVHCAIKGKSEKIVRWLVDVQYCPLQMFATSNKGNKSSYLPSLRTSKGKSILDLAMESQDCGILKFLVKEKDLSIFEVKNLNVVLAAMDALLKEEPSNQDDSMRSKASSQKMRTKKSTSSPKKDQRTKEKTKTESSITLAEKIEKVAIRNQPSCTVANDKSPFFPNRDESDDEAEKDKAFFFDNDDEESVCTTRPDICTICKEKNINCVAAPCGHQGCCMKCASQLRHCPVCRSVCQFISIYQP